MILRLTIFPKGSLDGQEETYSRTVDDIETVHDTLLHQINKLTEKLRLDNIYIKTVTLKARYSDFSTITRSKTLNEYTRNSDIIYTTALTLLSDLAKDSFRLIGYISAILPKGIMYS